MRKFEELITEIEHDGERFVPIEKIAKLAVSHRATFQENVTFDVFSSEDSSVFICVLTSSFGVKLQVELDNFNVSVYEFYNLYPRSSCPFYNQVQIVKNLIKWGFVEP